MFSKPCGLFCKLFSPRGLCSINARPSSSKCFSWQRFCLADGTKPSRASSLHTTTGAMGRTKSKRVQSYSFLLLMMSIHREIIVSMKKITQFNKYTVMNATMPRAHSFSLSYMHTRVTTLQICGSVCACVLSSNLQQHVAALEFSKAAAV